MTTFLVMETGVREECYFFARRVGGIERRREGGREREIHGHT